MRRLILIDWMFVSLFRFMWLGGAAVVAVGALGFWIDARSLRAISADGVVLEDLQFSGGGHVLRLADGRTIGVTRLTKYDGLRGRPLAEARRERIGKTVRKDAGSFDIWADGMPIYTNVDEFDKYYGLAALAGVFLSLWLILRMLSLAVSRCARRQCVAVGNIVFVRVHTWRLPATGTWRTKRSPFRIWRRDGDGAR
jgi:hypothetical protein